MKEKRIWIVSELFYPDETAVAYIFTRIANHLSEKYKICVICGPEFYDKNKSNFVDCISISSDIKIYRTKAINLDKNSLIQRTLKTLLLSFRLAYLMCSKISKNEMVILSTNPAFLILLVRPIKFFKRIRLQILVHDVFPENTIPGKIFKNNKVFLYKILKYLFDGAYACSDHLIVIGRDMKELMLVKLKHYKHQPKISVVTNWTNPDEYHVIQNIKNKKKIVLQYAGNIGRVQGLKELIDAYRISNNDCLFLIIRGTGAQFELIQNYIKQLNIKNIALEGGFSRNSESEILDLCDIGIVSLSEGMYGLGVPSKTYHLLSAGKPILYVGEPGTEVALMINENEIGWSLDVRKKGEIVSFFNNLNLTDFDTIRNKGSNARLLAENVYNEKSVLQKMENVIQLEYLGM